MFVQLRVEEDEELRLYIKDLIKGQVQALLRLELKQLLREIVTSHVEKAVDTSATTSDGIVQQYIKREVENLVRETVRKAGSWNENYVLKIIRDTISHQVIHDLAELHKKDTL